jgi:hypothetical protein
VSSAILYVAIVAIWIGVLVPRWLKHENSHSGSAGLRRLSRHFGAGRPDDEDAPRAGFDPEGRPRYTSFVPPETPAEGAPEASAHAPAHHSKSQSDHAKKVSSVATGNKEGMAELYEAAGPRSAVQSYGWSADEAVHHERLDKSTTGGGSRPPVPAPAADEPSEASEWASEDASGAYESARASVRVPPRRAPLDPMEDTERRAQIVRGRRRMLWLLLVLTAVGIGLAYLQLAAWWVMIPPTVLLVGYLLLLREAAHADAEARERRGAAAAQAPAHSVSEPAVHARSDAAPAPAPAAASAAGPSEGPLTVEETGPRADIIDLSEHVGDQLYDQYADAKLRAVGD